MATDRYLPAEGVFPPDLVAKCQQALDGNRSVVTFERILYSALNEGEAQLGEVLVHQCRQMMLRKDTRQVYFPGSRRSINISRKAAAERLFEGGHSGQAVADAVGVSRRTLYNWGLVSERDPGSAGHVTDCSNDPGALVRGLEILAQCVSAKKRPKLGADHEAALNRVAKSLKLSPDKTRARAYAAAAALADLGDTELED